MSTTSWFQSLPQIVRKDLLSYLHGLRRLSHADFNNPHFIRLLHALEDDDNALPRTRPESSRPSYPSISPDNAESILHQPGNSNQPSSSPPTKWDDLGSQNLDEDEDDPRPTPPEPTTASRILAAAAAGLKSSGGTLPGIGGLGQQRPAEVSPLVRTGQDKTSTTLPPRHLREYVFSVGAFLPPPSILAPPVLVVDEKDPESD